MLPPHNGSHAPRCDEGLEDSGGAPLTMEFGQTVRLPFQSCDYDALPIKHAIPAAEDGRSFEVLLLDAAGGSLDVSIEYMGRGAYDAIVAPPRLGEYSLTITLGGEAVAPARIVTVVCPGETQAGLAESQ